MRKIVVLCLACLAGAPQGWASLGQTADSITSDQRRLEGQLRSAALQGYTVQQISRGDGQVVNEYVSPAGVVFGVSWTGPTMPNLSQILGNYFTQFENSVKTRVRRNRSNVVVREGDLVVESGGRPRGFHGRAYVPSLVPANVSQTVIQ